MKIQCNVCETAEATVLCCADEAALCWSCDKKVHAANKLASKHQRVPLSTSSSPLPKCDICQEAVGFFFCLEDRALLCRKCDVAIHKANSSMSAHQRFLLTGVKAGLESTAQETLPSLGKSNSSNKSEVESHPPSRKIVPTASVQCNKILPASVNEAADFVPPKLSSTVRNSCEHVQQWQLDEFLGLPELNLNYSYMETGSSKAESGKLGDSDSSPILQSLEIELDFEESLAQVPDASWAVPEIPSPPTTSGLSWPKSVDKYMETPAFVPDVCYSPMLSPYSSQLNGSDLKRRRQ